MHKMTSIKLKMVKVVILCKIVVNLSVAQLVTTVIFSSGWDKSHGKWENSRLQIYNTKNEDLYQVQFLQLVPNVWYKLKEVKRFKPFDFSNINSFSNVIFLYLLSFCDIGKEAYSSQVIIIMYCNIMSLHM